MIGAPLIMAIGLNNVTGIQYLIPARKQNLYTKSVAVAAVLNFVLNLMFIPHLKAIGALLASVIAELSIVIVQLIDVKKDFDIKIVLRNSLKYIISGIIMFIPIYILGLYFEASIITTLIQIILGAFVYGIMLIILKDSFVLNITKFITSKIFKNKGKEKIC